MDPHLPLPNTEPSANFLDTIRTSIASRLAAILGGEVIEAVYASVEVSSQRPDDFTLFVPKLGAILDGADPDEVAAKVAKEYTPDDLIEAVAANGSFLSFYIRSTSMIHQVLRMIYSMSQSPGREYGTNTLGNGKRAVVEFSSPSIAMAFREGHMRSTVIGAALSNIYAANGWEVIRLNYLGDCGTQYAVLAVAFDKYGSEERLEKDPIRFLRAAYVVADRELNAKNDPQLMLDTRKMAKDYINRLEKGDPHLTGMLKRFRELSIRDYAKEYEKFGVQFDVYAGESLVSPETIREVTDQLEKQGLLVGQTMKDSRKPKRDERTAVEVEGGENNYKDAPAKDLALAIDLDEFRLGKPVLQTPDGSVTHLVRDIAGALDRYQKYHFDKMLYVVEDQQKVHFAQCFKILSLLEDCPFDASEKLTHIRFGRVNGKITPSGAGDLGFLKQILDFSKGRMMERMQAGSERFATIEDPEFTSAQVGLTAVKVQDMLVERIMPYTFDWDRITSFEGDTGPYLQCSHVRLCSLERDVAHEDGLTVSSSSLDSINTTLLLSVPTAREIVFHLATFPDVVRTALKTHEPCNLVSYCFQLARLIDSSWETIVVKGLVGRGEKELAMARLLLYTCARNVLGSAMSMLSLNPLERM